MDNQKILAEELLKADGIDPTTITESERAAFRDMLNSEKKRLKRLAWVPIGTMWIFVVAIIILTRSEGFLEKLHIPYAIPVILLATTAVIVMVKWEPAHIHKLEESNKKISKLHYFVYNRHRGFAMVSKKDGKRIIHWPSLLILTTALWLFMSLGGAGVYYLMCHRWIYASSSEAMWIHIFLTIYMPLGFLVGVLRSGLKAPLEELVEVETKPKQSEPASRPDIRSNIIHCKITKLAFAAVIAILTVIGIWVLNEVNKYDSEPTINQKRDIVANNSGNQSNLSRQDVAAIMGILPRDIEKNAAEAKMIVEMAANNDVKGLIGMLSAEDFQNKVLAAEYLGEIGDERALPELIKLKEQYVCGLSKDGSTVFRKDAWGYTYGMSSGAFAAAICKIKTKDLSTEEQIDVWFELLDDCIEPEMTSNQPYLVLGSNGLLDIPINEFGYGCFDLGKRVAAELEKYDDPTIVTRLRKTDNKGAAISAVWMEIQDMEIEQAIDRCVEIARNENEGQQYGAIKCLGRLGEPAIYALDGLAIDGYYEAMRNLGYYKKNPKVLEIICWHITHNRNYFVRELAISQFSHSNILQYQQPILLQALAEALYDPSQSIRRRAASLFRTIAGGENKLQLFELKYEDDLLIALKHSDKEVRGFAAQALQKLGSTRLDEEVPDPPEIRTDLED